MDETQAINELRHMVYVVSDAGVSADEIREQVEDALHDLEPAKPHVGGVLKPKPKKVGS